ncbi:DoxX family protein [Pedobacter sp. MR22-3]|uniref:DoxX family protein n=1 Tax=Pedobacter sp. MR22-3 TaxID=2994552 RepID=UPI002245A060|nr:DoxX family protein [Pedobacter sp. MR22-3]MCX2585623.1 DoxX family protein [Pedobacter sp. MR22-3]
MNKISSTLNPDLGILLLRIATGGLMIFHGIAKLFHGFDFIKQSLIEKGLPAFVWVGVPVGEVLAPLMLILGIFSRLSGLMIAIVMLFAIYLAHGMSAFTINENGGLDGELALIYMFAGIAIFFTGGGKYVLYKAGNEWTK